MGSLDFRGINKFILLQKENPIISDYYYFKKNQKSAPPSSPSNKRPMSSKFEESAQALIQGFKVSIKHKTNSTQKPGSK